MTRKTYVVYFTRTSVGRASEPLPKMLTQLASTHGQHLPVIAIAEDFFQLRDVTLVGKVWQGTFAKLRDDAPHVVSAVGTETEMDLADGDRIVEKCHFLLRAANNVLVWQVNRGAGGLSKFENYLSRLLDEVVILPHIVYSDQMDQILAGDVYEIDFAYDRPRALSGQSPRWNQNVFDMMSQVDAAHAKFLLRAERGTSLTEKAKTMVKQMVNTNGTKKLKVKLTDEHDPIDLFVAPIKGAFNVELAGRYAKPREVFQGLEAAYDEHRGSIRDA